MKTDKTSKLKKAAFEAHKLALDNPCQETTDKLKIAEEALQDHLATFKQPSTQYVPADVVLISQRMEKLMPLSKPKKHVRMKDSYTCKHCGEPFEYFWQLGVHMHKVRTQERKNLSGRSQLSPIPTEIPKQFKMLKVEHLGTSTRIYSTSFIPPDWEYVRVYKPVDVDKGRWVFFEPPLLQEVRSPASGEENPYK